MAIIQSLDAGKTDLARQYHARGDTEAILLGDWSFQVGTDGWDDDLDPTTVDPVDYGLQGLGAAAGGLRPLGTVLASGGGATAALTATEGLVQITGLSGIPQTINKRWLRITGSADPLVNGTWVISQWNDATDILIHNPLMTAGDTGLTWELRESVVLSPNPRAVAFCGSLPAVDASVDEFELGEVGIFCRVIRAPASPGIVGDTLLFANAHHTALAKSVDMKVGYYVCVQL